MRAFDMAANLPWAITEASLRNILEIAARENLSVEAVEAQLGRRLDNTRSVKVRDGVAQIPVTGPIFRRADFFTEISGATAVATLARDLTAALADSSVHSIIFDIDSPGGEVTGINEFADMIFAARGKKPMTAYVDGLGCSAAYWIASAADEIVCDATSALGSIGVVLSVRDPTKATARDIEFVSSQSPDKRPDPTSERGRSQIQQTVDDLGDVFVAAVARNRGVSEETVLSDFGQGGILVGQKAVDAGLADRLGSFEAVQAELVARHRERPAGARRATMSDTQTTENQELAQLRADLAAQKAANAQLQERMVRETAKAWAAGQVTSHKIMPAEQAIFAELYAVAALDDAQHPRTVTITTASGTVTMSRAELLQHAVATRPAHNLTTETVQTPAPTTPPAQPANGNPSAANGGQQSAQGGMTAERRAELLKLTPVGQTVLEQKN